MNKELTREAEYIRKITDGDLLKIHTILDHQLSVLQSRAQVLVSIAGIVITVTGFSGRIIAGTHIVSQILVIAGLFTVLASAVYVLTKVMRIRWITGIMKDGDDSPESLIKILKMRNMKNHAFRIGSIILFIGLVFYCIAISIMLMNPK